MKKLLIVSIVVGMLISAGCDTVVKEKPTPTGITFEEIVATADSEPNIPYGSNSLKRAELLEQHRRKQNSKYIGELVEWAGKVVSVDESPWNGKLKVEFQHVKSHLSDVTVTFPDSSKHILLELHRGDMIVYRGRIAEIHNGGWFNIQLYAGQIIKQKDNG